MAALYMLLIFSVVTTLTLLRYKDQTFVGYTAFAFSWGGECRR